MSYVFTQHHCYPSNFPVFLPPASSILLVFTPPHLLTNNPNQSLRALPSILSLPPSLHLFPVSQDSKPSHLTPTPSSLLLLPSKPAGVLNFGTTMPKNSTTSEPVEPSTNAVPETDDSYSRFLQQIRNNYVTFPTDDGLALLV